LEASFIENILKKASDLGCTFSDVRYQKRDTEVIQIDNQTLKTYSYNTLCGVGIRVIYGGSISYASTSDISKQSLNNTLQYAIKGARAQKSKEEEPYCTVNLNKADIELKKKIDPMNISPEEKIDLAMEVNKAAFIDKAVKTSMTAIGYINNETLFVSSDDSEIKVKTPLIGIAHTSVAQDKNIRELARVQKSDCAGWELLESLEIIEFAEDISNLAINAAASKHAPSGTFPVVIDQDVIGLVLHEALGHACEGDGVVNKTSILKDKIGEKIAGSQVSIIDEGVVTGGYFHPYDDEGVEKEKTVIVDKGVLQCFLTDRRSAKNLGTFSTGNGRLQDFENMPIVRQTNFYMTEGDYSLEELFEDINFGVYIKGKGGGGGQVETGGTFTFGVGPSQIIRNGEPQELIRGVVISGDILDTMNSVDGIGKDVKIKTNVFGGCGKGGQQVKTGMGGPAVRAQKLTIGGRT
jgi:TldD protein